GRSDRRRADGGTVSRGGARDDRHGSQCGIGYGCGQSRADGSLFDGVVVFRAGTAMKFDRRRFLQSSGALTASALAPLFSRYGIDAANAQTATNYQALLCVFLFGGNDSNNMIVS